MISSELTKGMSRLEVLIVFLAAFTTKRERERLTEFFQEWKRKNPLPKCNALDPVIPTVADSDGTAQRCEPATPNRRHARPQALR